MVNCSICHHPGAHAVVPREGWPTRCGDCPRREADARAEREQGE